MSPGRGAALIQGSAVPFMAATAVDTTPAYRSRAERSRTMLGRLVPAALLAPSFMFLAAFFALPALGLVAYSFLTQPPEGTIGLPVTLQHYRHFFGTALY